MARLVWPVLGAVAERFTNAGGFLDRLRRDRADYRRARDEVRSRIEARADAWMATARYRDIERIEHYAAAEAYEVVELLVLAALDGDSHPSDDFAETADIFARRVIENIRVLEPDVGPRMLGGRSGSGWTTPRPVMKPAGSRL